MAYLSLKTWEKHGIILVKSDRIIYYHFYNTLYKLRIINEKALLNNKRKKRR